MIASLIEPISPARTDHATYKEYHYASMAVGDVDPSYSMLRYLCERFELNIEQRYWLAFLYATCYCGPTVYYIYNEFPDFENVNEDRLERWWAANREKLYFQTDRRWVRSRNQWCDMFRSYKKHVGALSQEQLFKTFRTPIRYQTYDNAWAGLSSVYQMGRFAMFLWLEAVHVVTDFPMRPLTMDINSAESCKNGLLYALGRPELIGVPLNKTSMFGLQQQFDALVRELSNEHPGNNVWNIETTLCAYKKYRLGKRWVGYYLDRQHDEIANMQSKVTEGVAWSVLWDYRREKFGKGPLKLKEQR
jgi:hypothetical protein